MIAICIGKILSDIFVVKKYARCYKTSRLNNKPEVHDRLHNYKGIRKAMKSESALVFKNTTTTRRRLMMSQLFLTMTQL